MNLIKLITKKKNQDKYIVSKRIAEVQNAVGIPIKAQNNISQFSHSLKDLFPNFNSFVTEERD